MTFLTVWMTRLTLPVSRAYRESYLAAIENAGLAYEDWTARKEVMVSRLCIFILKPEK